MKKLPPLLLLLSSCAFAQTPNGPATSQAILNQAIAAFSPLPVASVHFSGTAHAIAGSTDERGTFTLDLDRNGESTFALAAGSLSRNE